MRSGAWMLVPVLSAVLAACTSAAAPTAAPTASPRPTATPVATMEPTGTPAPDPKSVPTELLGKWQSTFSEGDVAALELKEHGYAIVREAAANGRLELVDGALLFSHSSLCTGEGRYSWSLDGDTLHLESIGTDACEGRAKSLDGATYVRL